MNGDNAKRPLPFGWRWAKLGEVCEFKYGQGLPEHQRVPGSVAVYGSNGVVGQHAASITREPTLVVGRKGSIGRVLYSAAACWPIDTTYFVDATALKVASDLRWLYFALLWLRLDLLNKATGVPGLNRDDAYRQLLPLPPIDEQVRIAARLLEQVAVVERAKRATLAEVEAARALPASIIRQVFESDEAKAWPRKRIGEIAETGSGTTPARGRTDYYQGTIPWVKTAELRDGFINDTEEHITEVALRETSLRLLPAGSLLIAMYGQGQTRGRTGLLLTPATTNQACFAVLPNPAEFDPAFLQWWVRHNYLRLRRETDARGGSQPNLNGNVLRSEFVPLPPISLQRRIVATLSRHMEGADEIARAGAARLDAVNALPGALREEVFGGFEPSFEVTAT